VGWNRVAFGFTESPARAYAHGSTDEPLPQSCCRILRDPAGRRGLRLRKAEGHPLGPEVVGRCRDRAIGATLGRDAPPAILRGMTRWMSRFRRSAMVLLGVHLLQATAMLAGPVCEPTGAVATMPSAPASERGSAADPPGHRHHAMAHHAGHGAGDAIAASVALPDVPERSPAHPHGPSNVVCPMAMTCTVVAVASTTPTITTRVVAVPDAPAIDAGFTPRSIRRAPEPPPPRA